MSQRKNTTSSDNLKFSAQDWKKALSIFRYIKPYKWYFTFGMIFLVLGSLAFLILMQVPGEMLNKANGSPTRLNLELKQYLYVLIVILLIQGVLSYFRVICFAVVSEKGMAGLRKDLYNKIITQSISFFEKRRVGELTSRITTDVEQLQSVFSITLAEFLRQIVILIGGILFIVILTPKLSMVMLLTFPAIVILGVVFGRYIRKLSRKRQDQLALTNVIVEETFQSFASVKSFANEFYEALRYGGSVDKVVNISLSFAKVRGLFFAFIISVLFGGIFFILWQGTVMVQNGEMESGDLLNFIIYTGILGGAIASFGNLFATIAQAVGATERIQEILQSNSEKDLIPDTRKLSDLIKGSVSYENVHFSYPTRKDVPVLKGVNLEVKKGEKVALVGQSGSGKSTIIQLLLKFYDLDEGQIKIDDKPLLDFDLHDYRKQIGIVPQDVVLFGGTIKENILYGKPGCTEEELLDAARRSHCLDFINTFPDKFETIVGERGVKLSGGQRQRIAIARAILKDPVILLLDEATSSLDAESEKVVQEALDELLKGRTSIIIAHRLSTIKNVDRIYVLEDGVIVEKGSHDELFKNEKGSYYNLAKLQFDLV
jgi:ABC-type multidrug transport system fused ATPase/permease subunit